MSKQKYVFVVLFWPLIGSQKQVHSFSTRNSSDCISEVSCSLWSYSLSIKSVTNLFKPWEILTHEWELSFFTESILISTPYSLCKQLVVTSNTGPILVFQRIQPFGSDDFSISWQSVLTTCHWFCKFLRIPQCPLSWNAVRRQPLSGILHQYKSLSIDLVVEAFPLVPCNFCNKFHCAGISIEGLGVIINNFAGSNNG